MGQQQYIKLPIDINPIIRSYRIHAYLINIVGNIYKNEFEKYIISNYLCLHNGIPNILIDYLDFHINNNYLNNKDMFRDNSWFYITQLYEFDIANYIKNDHIKKLIIDFLSDGYYVIQNVNEACLFHTIKYGSDTVNNISLLYGYDALLDSFMMLDYNYHGDFCGSLVPAREYFMSISSTIGKNRLNFIKIKEGLQFDFDFEHSLNLLKCHVYSLNAYPDHDEYNNHLFGYESVKRSLDEIQNNGINMINIRVIMEHKNILLKYFRYITDYNYVNNQKYYEFYKKINVEMRIVFMKILKKSVLKSNDYKPEINRICELNFEERKLLKNFLMEQGRYS